jgi:putative flippase GtrA
MTHEASLPRAQRWLRFVLGGVVNTAFTYGIYLALNLAIDYQWAYFIAYILGIAFAYWFNARMVFRVPLSWKGLLAYPLVYVIQYGVSAIALGILVELLGVAQALAPLVVTAAMLPVTYIMSKLIIKLTHTPKLISENNLAMIKIFSNARIPASQNVSDTMVHAKTMTIWLAFILPSIVIVLAIWLPFGFSLTGLIEEWGVLGLFNVHGLFFVVDSANPMAAHALRPLTVFPHALAYFLDPNSFYYWHVLLILALIIKGSASSYLIWNATGSLGWAMVMGALVLVYPADTMQLSFRSLHINWALALFLLASSILVAAYEQKRRVVSYSLAAVASLLLFVASCMYEATLTLVPLPLLILYVRDGFRKSFHQFRAQVGLVIVWMAGAGLYIIYVVLVAPKIATSSYQEDILVAGNSSETLIHSLPKLFTVGALRGLLGGWFDAIRMVFMEFDSYTYLFTSVTIIGILFLLIARFIGCLNLQHSSNLSSAETLPHRLAFAGLLLLLLGYAPYPLFQISGHQRTFLFATPGAAMVWVALLLMISRSARLRAGLAALALIFLGLGAQLFQFHHYEQISNSQRNMLRGIVESFDGNLGNKTLLLLDESNQLNHAWMFLTVNLRGALSYIYGHPVNAIQVCHMPSKEWQLPFPDPLGRKGTCAESENDWVFRYPEAVSGQGYVAPIVKDLKVAGSQVVTLTINPDGSTFPNPALNRYRENLHVGQSTVARRYRGVLAKSSSPFSFTIFEGQKTKDRFKWDYFGD